jgi:predicted metal-dependent HD superfamily phosphohydrolase
MDTSPPIDLARRLSFDCPASLLERLAVRYAEPHRRYHTWSHILACLDARHRITDARLPDVDLALLFHDAIYDPLAVDNEVRSAELLVEDGRRGWIDERVLQRARALVLATRYGGDTSPEETEEACIVTDADLSILGAERSTFEQYERQVREEYARIAGATYAAGRSAVLRGFLARPVIYATRPGQRLWEARARENLEASLALLG